jgi:hypothetical protein
VSTERDEVAEPEKLLPCDDGAHAHDISCARWVPYDENHKRYYPDRPCSCNAAIQAAKIYTDTLRLAIEVVRNQNKWIVGSTTYVPLNDIVRALEKLLTEAK